MTSQRLREALDGLAALRVEPEPTLLNLHQVASADVLAAVHRVASREVIVMRCDVEEAIGRRCDAEAIDAALLEAERRSWVLREGDRWRSLIFRTAA